MQLENFMRSECTDAVRETVDEALTELRNIVDLLPPWCVPNESVLVPQGDRRMGSRISERSGEFLDTSSHR